MLYIDVLVNNVPIKAFVDSGAQTTIMSPDAAERCGIRRLIDTRFGGIARGVGTAVILGRVHLADIQIGQFNLASSFTVMEGKDVDLLLGLDMLKRHQMCIDLKQDALIVQGEKIPFLPENQLPKMMEEILENEPKIEGPQGTRIGATTGTVEQVEPPAASPQLPSQGQSKPSSSRITIHPAGSKGNVHSTKSGQSSAAPLHPRPQTQTPIQTQQLTGSAFGQPQAITPESIAKITELGFSREEAIQALEQVGGNVELAIGLLL
jgi:DNA damage-inducible protein 1